MTSVTQWKAVFLFSALNFISRGWCASFTTHSNGTNSNTFYSPNYPNYYPNSHDELYIAYLLTAGPQEVLLEYEVTTEAILIHNWIRWTTTCIDYVYFPEVNIYMCGQMQGTSTMLVPGDNFNFSFHSNWRNTQRGFWIRFTVLEASTTSQTIMTTETTTTEKITTTEDETTPIESAITTGSDETTTITTARDETTTITTASDETTTITTASDETTTISTASDETTTITTARDETTTITTASDETTTISTASDETTTITTASDETTTITTASDEMTTTQNVMTTASGETTSQRETHETTHDIPTTTATAGTTEQQQIETTTRPSSPLRPVTHSREQRPCNCIRLEAPPKNATAEEAEEKKKELIQQIKDNLTVSAANVSATRRRYISASDDRSSSVVMGMFIAVVCFMPLIGIVAADSLRLALAVYRSLSK